MKTKPVCRPTRKSVLPLDSAIKERLTHSIASANDEERWPILDDPDDTDKQSSASEDLDDDGDEDDDDSWPLSEELNFDDEHFPPFRDFDNEQSPPSLAGNICEEQFPRPQRRFVRLTELVRIVPLSASTIWRKVRDGSFVAPVKLSVRCTAWDLEAVYEWIRQRSAS